MISLTPREDDGEGREEVSEGEENEGEGAGPARLKNEFFPLSFLCSLLFIFLAEWGSWGALV